MQIAAYCTLGRRLLLTRHSQLVCDEGDDMPLRLVLRVTRAPEAYERPPHSFLNADSRQPLSDTQRRLEEVSFTASFWIASRSFGFLKRTYFEKSGVYMRVCTGVLGLVSLSLSLERGFLNAVSWWGGGSRTTSPWCPEHSLRPRCSLEFQEGYTGARRPRRGPLRPGRARDVGAEGYDGGLAGQAPLPDLLRRRRRLRLQAAGRTRAALGETRGAQARSLSLAFCVFFLLTRVWGKHTASSLSLETRARLGSERLSARVSLSLSLERVETSLLPHQALSPELWLLRVTLEDPERISRIARDLGVATVCGRESSVLNSKRRDRVGVLKIR